MDADRWEKAREVFEVLVARPVEEWEELLSRLCGEDAALHAEVCALVEGHRQAGSWLSEPAVPRQQEDSLPTTEGPLLPLAQESIEETPDSLAGRRIGPYKVIRRLGQGGMGVVYLAARADDEFRRWVALKVLQPGMGQEEIVRRFRAERQILAALDHPNIARMLDGGSTEEGLPFFVMEHVEGQPIDAYCDRLRLDTRARLELFCKVCSAVQYAHAKLVVHRDLKPSNILVTSTGVPKLLDFGIAKLLNPELASPELVPTATLLRFMTPDFASPEQVRGEPITTAADVYSLGVLLYYLLTGHRPYHVYNRSPVEVLRVICEQEPESPSLAVLRREEIPGPGSSITVTPESVSRTRDGAPARLHRRLAGDLDNIVLMALRKEPGRRYASVEKFAEDIHRHLDGRPVLARKDTITYRWGKFINRHRIGVAAAAIFVTACLVFGIVMGIQRAKTIQERDRAERVTEFLVDLFEASNPFSGPGSERGDLTAREILNYGAAKLAQGLDDQPELEATLEGTIGRIFQRLGLQQEARPWLESSLETRRQLLGEQHPQVARSSYELAVLNMNDGRYEDAGTMLEKAREIQASELGSSHPELADTLSVLGAVRMAEGNYEKAESILIDALRIRRELYGDDHSDVAKSVNDLGLLRLQTGRFQEAQGLFREALEIRQRILEPSHPALAESFNNLATVLRNQGQYRQAEPLYRKSLEGYRRSLGDRHPYVAIVMTNLATVLFHSGHLEEAEWRYREAIELHRDLVGDRHPRVATTLYRLAELLVLKGDWAESEQMHREALAIRQEALGNEHPDVAKSLERLGYLAFLKGDVGTSEELLLESLEMRNRLLAEQHPDLADSQSQLAILYTELGDPAKAEVHARKALAILRSVFSEQDSRVKRVESILGGCLVDLGRYQEAEPLLRRSFEVLRKQEGESGHWVLEARERLRRFEEVRLASDSRGGRIPTEAQDQDP